MKCDQAPCDPCAKRSGGPSPQVSVDQKAPLKAHLEKAFGRPIVLIIPTSYNATVEGLGNGSIDVAYLGGLTYVKAHARYGVVPLVQRDIDRQFHSLFITRTDTGIASLGQLKDKTFCFGDINSTSGHLYPYLAMTQAGVSVDKTLKGFRYTGRRSMRRNSSSSIGRCSATC